MNGKLLRSYGHMLSDPLPPMSDLLVYEEMRIALLVQKYDQICVQYRRHFAGFPIAFS